jgi:DNA-binding transcriptional regulator YhcF (GntR family)
MDVFVTRSSAISLQDQIAGQLKMKMLVGELAAGHKLPSVRALARRLRVHPNTVAASYQLLEAQDRIVLRPGSGAYVKECDLRSRDREHSVQVAVKRALDAVWRQGFSRAEVRQALEEWLRQAPDAVLVIDSERETAQIMMAEIRSALPGACLSCCSVAELKADPSRAAGRVIVSLPYYSKTGAALGGGATCEVATTQVTPEHRTLIRELPAGSLVLVVSHSRTVLPFAAAVLHNLRGPELLVQTRLASSKEEWQPLGRSADLVFADIIAAPIVRAAGPRRLHEFRVVSAASLAGLRSWLTAAPPA